MGPYKFLRLFSIVFIFTVIFSTGIYLKGSTIVMASGWHSIKDPLSAQIKITTENTKEKPAYPSTIDLKAANVRAYYIPSQGFILRSDDYTGIVTDGQEVLVEGENNGYYKLKVNTSVIKTPSKSSSEILYVTGNGDVSKSPVKEKHFTSKNSAVDKSNNKAIDGTQNIKQENKVSSKAIKEISNKGNKTALKKDNDKTNAENKTSVEPTNKEKANSGKKLSLNENKRELNKTPVKTEEHSIEGKKSSDVNGKNIKSDSNKKNVNNAKSKQENQKKIISPKNLWFLLILIFVIGIMGITTIVYYLKNKRIKSKD
ncbi:hypothetical protein [Heyndrickxia ginsengihumi]|uniref:hypothetical protein n=1 Tax=Heyndrickxia ginsengihumi TaxID=363870 RepID=UPI0004726A3C|nr:hypothetical protein [Heyndrickxia ginsengihumi]